MLSQNLDEKYNKVALAKLPENMKWGCGIERTQPASSTEQVPGQAPKLQRSPVLGWGTKNKNQRTHRSVIKPGSLITRQMLWEEAFADDNRGRKEYLHVLQH